MLRDILQTTLESDLVALKIKSDISFNSSVKDLYLELYFYIL